jgi:hypothetical protein
MEPMNPFAASWLASRPLLRRAWSEGRPDFGTKRRMVKEFYGGCWLFANAYARPKRGGGWRDNAGRVRADLFPKLRKLLPCGRVQPLLALHFSDSKYTVGSGAKYSRKRTTDQVVAAGCSPAPLQFGSDAWEASHTDRRWTAAGTGGRKLWATRRRR